MRIDGITATAKCSTDLRGLLGFDGVSPELADIELTIEVDTPDPESKTGPMFDAWRARCPIYLAVHESAGGLTDHAHPLIPHHGRRVRAPDGDVPGAHRHHARRRATRPTRLASASGAVPNARLNARLNASSDV